MHAFTYFVLSFIGVAFSLPVFLRESKRSLIDVSPNVDLGLGLSNDNSCLGIGISVCDPITVNSTQTSTTTKNATNNPPQAKPVSNGSNEDSGDNSLINLSPDLGLDLNASNDNSCLGIGISACDPITVDSDVTKTVNSTSSNSSDSPSSSSSPVPEKSSTTSSSSPASSDTSNGDQLLNLSPDVSPDLNLSNDNSCQGIGISACDPITVGSDVTNSA